jgi:hypothetical protein
VAGRYDHDDVSYYSLRGGNYLMPWDSTISLLRKTVVKEVIWLCVSHIPHAEFESMLLQPFLSSRGGYPSDFSVKF